MLLQHKGWDAYGHFTKREESCIVHIGWFASWHEANAACELFHKSKRTAFHSECIKHYEPLEDDDA